MKKSMIILWLCFSVFALNAQEKVIFIPGWYTEWINYSGHREVLQELFPNAEIKVHKWDSNRLWQNAKKSAAQCINEVKQEISAGGTPEKYIIAGHSLGGRIAIKLAVQFAAENIRVKQIILLGTAAMPDKKELSALQKVSRQPVINIFCSDDNMLKLYIRKEKEFPLGFTGIARRIKNFRQYRMPVDDRDVKLGKLTLLPGSSVESFRETAAHLAANYLKCLQKALRGELAEYYLDYPALEKVAAQGEVSHDNLPGFRQTDEFDSWIFSERKIKKRFRITAPSGKHFYYTSKQIAVKNFNAIKQQLLNKN